MYLTQRHAQFSLSLKIFSSGVHLLCRGQALDGAANMRGIRNGVQALLKKEENRSLHVQCLANSLNLCVQTTIKQCETMRNVTKFVYELVQLISFPPNFLLFLTASGLKKSLIVVNYQLHH